MTKLHKLIHRIAQMADATYFLLKNCLLLVCAMLFSALLLLIFGGGFSLHSYETYRCAKELFSLAAVVLLIASIGSVCIEEFSLK